MRRRLALAVTGAAALSLSLGAWLPANATTDTVPKAKAEKKTEVVIGKPFTAAKTRAQRQWLDRQNRTRDDRKVACKLGKQSKNRSSSCFLAFAPFKLVLKPGNQVIGTGVLGYGNSTELNYKRKTYTQDVNLGLVEATDAAISGTLATVTLGCNTPEGNGCKAKQTGGGGWQQLPYPTTNTHFTFQVTSDAKSVLYHQPPTKVDIRHITATNTGTTYPGEPAQVRCDSEKVGSNQGRGCVNWEYAPTYTMDGTDGEIFEVAGHVAWAQRNLKNQWGLRGKGKPLHKLSDEDLQRKNRRKACGNANPGPGQSCDEFPFASTWEGAHFQSDYSTKNLNALQNSTEGGRKYRGKFYRTNRVIDGDAFWVKVKY
ncbi:NucA/NucB deoxyribonuclease domain-containing protein [Streptomyces sp. NPDC050636]|uniref:NucA/NucB deoxyribonuclease domain-containing protein n=1 Tax=Streptomyces sp. NPDC050636 TaxID=3154510 RepID=UPI003448F8F3